MQTIANRRHKRCGGFTLIELVVSGTTDGWLYNETTGDFAINDAVGVTY